MEVQIHEKKKKSSKAVGENKTQENTTNLRTLSLFSGKKKKKSEKKGGGSLKHGKYFSVGVPLFRYQGRA